MIHTNMTKTEPCDSCPFRTDRESHLNPGIASDIVKNLRDGGSQPCWETVEEWDDNGVPVYSESEEHCAGALIAMERNYQRTAWMKWSEKIGRYDRTRLSTDVPTYHGLWEFEQAMKDQYQLDCVAEMIRPVPILAPNP